LKERWTETLVKVCIGHKIQSLLPMVEMGLEETLTLYSVMVVCKENQCLKDLLLNKIIILEEKYQNRLYLNHWSDLRKEYITLLMDQEEIPISSIQMVEQILIIKKVIVLISKIICSFVIKKEAHSTLLKWINFEIIKFQVWKLTIIGPPKKPLFLIVKYSKVKNAQLINFHLEIKLLETQLVCKWTGID
jgi:hypothetical protein